MYNNPPSSHGLAASVFKLDIRHGSLPSLGLSTGAKVTVYTGGQRGAVYTLEGSRMCCGWIPLFFKNKMNLSNHPPYLEFIFSIKQNCDCRKFSRFFRIKYLNSAK